MSIPSILTRGHGSGRYSFRIWSPEGCPTTAPIPDGPAEGTTINIDHLVDDYYDVKGWEK